MEFKFNEPRVQTKYNYLKAFYKPTYRSYCAGHYTDDRRLYINIYRQIIRSLLVIDKIYGQSVLVDVAYNEEFQANCAALKTIKERFEQLEITEVA